jgi:hypothetical protein
LILPESEMTLGPLFPHLQSASLVWVIATASFQLGNFRIVIIDSTGGLIWARMQLKIT